MSLPFTQIEVAKIISSSVVLTVQSVSFQNKRILFIRYNGQIDTTFDVAVPDSSSLFELQSNPESENFRIEKNCLFGDNLNLKLSVLINQVSKLLYGRGGETRNLVVSLSSKLFKIKEISDFDVIIFILQLLGKVL